ncbi:hypothetical protein FB192DRAFT_1460727 [Mucor lusitanicus]|uniref:Very-long-chain 3-oxoacyl-CoA synthase n=1 Tax=Mucor circinelloides f. lusitanicus TaxID=29924 RepID=A0A8H4BB14_MUCCL|nr:hypothetical protein FB192DRAFT_1460727 [Mucor lusitanicus]
MLVWNWHHLNPAGMHRFQWVYGVTPMSDLSVIYVSWVAYFIVIIAVRWYMAERTRIDKTHKMLQFYNGSMIICSTFVWYTSSTSTWNIVRHQPGIFSYCHAAEYPAYRWYGGQMFYSMYICYLLRYYVFFDTVILALRKAKINTLLALDQSIFGSLATAIISCVQMFRYCYYFCHCTNSTATAAWVKNVALFFEIIQFIAGITLTGYQMSICPQSNCVLLSASINVTMVYMVVKFYDSSEKAVATTREHYIRRNSSKKELMEL